jgi:hypothetical protein
MEAVKNYVDIYMGLPVEDYLVAPFTVFAQFAYTFVVIVRALSLALDGWDVKALDRFIDLSDIAENASQRYEAVSRTTPNGISLNNNAFSDWGLKLRLAKSFHDTRLRTNWNISTSNVEGVEGRTGPIPETDLPSFMGFDDFWNAFDGQIHLPADLDLDFSSI